jgi:hypothetical protein
MESSRFYWLVNNIRKEFRQQIKICRDSNGLILIATPAIMKRWKIYPDTLLGIGSVNMSATHMWPTIQQKRCFLCDPH